MPVGLSGLVGPPRLGLVVPGVRAALIGATRSGSAGPVARRVVRFLVGLADHDILRHVLLL